MVSIRDKLTLRCHVARTAMAAINGEALILAAPLGLLGVTTVRLRKRNINSEAFILISLTLRRIFAVSRRSGTYYPK